MPFEYRINQDPSYLHLRISGQVTAEDYIQSFEEFLETETYAPSIPTLVEVGEKAEIAIDDMNVMDAEELSRLVEKARQDVGYRVAVTGGPLGVRTFIVAAQQLVNEQAKVRSFEAPAEARRWLLSQPRSRRLAS